MTTEHFGSAGETFGVSLFAVSLADAREGSPRYSLRAPSGDVEELLVLPCALERAMKAQTGDAIVRD
jgi:hypothetical protein